ncbi:MAG: hypothetical protein ACLP05_01090 [Candidatus Kryptoniota bacterium]
MTYDEALEELHQLIFNNWERYHFHKQGLTQSDFAAAEQKVRELQNFSTSREMNRKISEARINKIG